MNEVIMTYCEELQMEICYSGTYYLGKILDTINSKKIKGRLERDRIFNGEWITFHNHSILSHSPDYSTAVKKALKKRSNDRFVIAYVKGEENE